MSPSRILTLIAFIAFGGITLDAQSADRILATGRGLVVKSSDLSPEAKRLVEDQAQLIAADRKSTFEQWIFAELLATEAKARGISVEKVEAEALAKIAKPTEVQIKAVYDANRQSIGDRTLDQVRPGILDYLKREAESKQLLALSDELRLKHKFTELKNVGDPLPAADILATLGARKITTGEFEVANRISLYNFRARVHDGILGAVENAVYNKLLETEAKRLGTDSSGVIAAEVTNKLREYSDYERMTLEDALEAKLFRDYAVKFALPGLEPQLLPVTADDDPSIGGATAKVTVVAFVDFQCSSCAAFSPILKQVVNEFGGTARLVVRDYPLTSIHDNAMQAALAGYAARQQGKFFEMGDLMYRNQSALDTASLRSYAGQLGMDLAKFDIDMKSTAAAAEIKKDIVDGDSYGVSGTPTVFVNGAQMFRLSPARIREAIKQGLK